MVKKTQGTRKQTLVFGPSGYLVKIGTLMILRQVFIPNISNLQNLSDGDFWGKRTAAEDDSVSDYPSG